MATRTRNPEQLDLVLFGLRWLIPLAVLIDALLRTAPGEPVILSNPAWGLIIGTAIYNILVLLALNAGLPQQILAVLSVIVDSLLSAAAVVLLGPPLIWVGLLPAIIAGARFGWLTGLLIAGATVTVAFVGLAVALEGILPADSQVTFGLAALLLPFAGVASGAVTHARLASGEGVAERMDRQLANAREQMRVVYEMAATLSTSLNYERVLDMVMDVCVHGFERLGVSGRVSGAVLLFTQIGQDTVLRVASHRRLTPADIRATVPGLKGVLAEALSSVEPVTTTNAHDDPELKYFAAFRESKSVLCVPMRSGFESYGVLVLGLPTQRHFAEAHIQLIKAIANQGIVALQNASLYQNLLEEKSRIIDIDEDARKQLARDLHDGPTQTISAVAMRVSFIRRLIETKPHQAADELWKVEELARRAASEIRHMLFTLRPLVLEQQGLTPALEQLAVRMQETFEQKVVIEADPKCETHLDQQAKGVVFYIIEEAVTNARKHAQADVVTVKLALQGDTVVVDVTDNGQGFDLEYVEDHYEGQGSLGLINLRERAELVEGTLRIKTAPGEGTHISLLVPLVRSGGKLPAAPASA